MKLGWFKVEPAPAHPVVYSMWLYKVCPILTQNSSWNFFISIFLIFLAARVFGGTCFFRRSVQDL